MDKLDHPCKQTCSGWKQGYIKGGEEAKHDIEKMCKIPLKKISQALNYFTCGMCDAAATCEYAFDPYNTNGDCLAEKQNLVTGGHLVMIFI